MQKDILVHSDLPAPSGRDTSDSVSLDLSLQRLLSSVCATDVDILDDAYLWCVGSSSLRDKCLVNIALKTGRWEDYNNDEDGNFAEEIVHEEQPLKDPTAETYVSGYLQYVQYAFEHDMGIEVAPHHLWSVIAYYIAQMP
eukprot:TRINITY_DN116688_c0_g1_i1.p1 TRINITY_DN116688_c0_g1~~TRINITY_DN116688_c0_g1_i1.p1  ORF type:complete len:153 (+),score=17.66 TRINITY_DN116688_c0_g1_i1:40-459(+)